jgi:hypothetical protein
MNHWSNLPLRYLPEKNFFWQDVLVDYVNHS